mgnify:CR=1 FL=1
MSVWGLLSDIHGNLPALERALAQFRERGVERIAVLGDNLGRGDSDGCVELIHNVAEVSVVGNRDLDWQDRVGAEARAYVLGLPRLALVDDLAFTHGDPRLTRELSTSETTAGFRRARRWMTEHQARIWFFGHSHRARVWRLGGDGGGAALLFDAATESLPAKLTLQDVQAPESTWAVNLGSVGLPFPGKGPASAAVYDAERRQLEIVPL